jgi:hypothetical protein
MTMETGTAKAGDSNAAHEMADMTGMDASAVAAKPGPASGDGKHFGAAVTLSAATPISAIIKDPASYNGKRVMVEGSVVEVCEERGCWIRIASDKEFESIRFQVQDGVITFPLSLKGQVVQAEGVVAVHQLTRAQAIAQARETAKERGTLASFDSTTIKGPVTDVILNGAGAQVK